MTSTSAENVIRSWKDEDFRDNLSYSEMAAVPENPAGPLELTDDQLMAMNGGANPETVMPSVVVVIVSVYSVETTLTISGECC
jgi:mersacidin/lichenicidin family type 2 lantibiotic